MSPSSANLPRPSQMPEAHGLRTLSPKRDYSPYEAHPIAAAFPRTMGEAFAALVPDIRVNGLQEPIVLNPKRTLIVDGLDRDAACKEAGFTLGPEHFRVLDDSYDEDRIYAYIISANLRRRHMEPGRLAMIATRIEAVYAQEAKERQREIGRQRAAEKKGSRNLRSTDHKLSDQPQRTKRSETAAGRAAREVGVSESSYRRAKKLKTEAPDLAEEVQEGKLSLRAADQQRRRRLTRTPSTATPGAKAAHPVPSPPPRPPPRAPTATTA